VLRRRDLTIFSTSFLDLLSCGLGAIILLFLIFAGSKTTKEMYRGGAGVLLISVTNPASARIGVYVEFPGSPRVYATGRDPTSVVEIEPNVEGARDYVLVLNREMFRPTDRVVIYPFDIAEAASDISVTIVGEGTLSGARVQRLLKLGGPDYTCVLSFAELKK